MGDTLLVLLVGVLVTEDDEVEVPLLVVVIEVLADVLIVCFELAVGPETLLGVGVLEWSPLIPDVVWDSELWLGVVVRVLECSPLVPDVGCESGLWLEAVVVGVLEWSLLVSDLV